LRDSASPGEPSRYWTAQCIGCWGTELSLEARNGKQVMGSKEEEASSSSSSSRARDYAMKGVFFIGGSALLLSVLASPFLVIPGSTKLGRMPWVTPTHECFLLDLV
jgi:hypothetical protein